MYLDLLFFINLALNYWLLMVTAKLLFREPGFLRLMTGAAVGAGGAIAVINYSQPWLNLIAVTTIPAVMLLLVFWPLRWPAAALSWLVFFLVSFLTGGAAFAAQGLYKSVDGKEALGFALVFAGLILYLLPSTACPFLREKKWQKQLQYKLLVGWQGKQKVITALLDTGNRLRDPVGRRPVIITDFRSVAELLPPGVTERLQDQRTESWAVLADLQTDPLARYFILVPLRTLGPGEQLILGFIPEEITIFDGDQSWSVCSQVVLGLHRKGFGPTAEYEALLPPELIARGQV